MTPAKLYAMICENAKKRFSDFELPESQMRLKCLQSAPLKSSLLRDLCKVVGIQIVSREARKEFALTNNLKQLQDHYSDLIKPEAPKQRKGKVVQQVTSVLVSEEDLLSMYSYLPFSCADISKLFPVVKCTREMRGNGSMEIKKMIQSG
jgi:hypothetical protein